MNLTIDIHDSWAAHPGPLSRLLAHLAALEAPAPWTPPATREPGCDDDDAASLARLLDGIDSPEPAPAATPAAATPRTSTTPPAARPSAKPFEGIPTTGRQMYRWACDRKALPEVNRVGKSLNYPRRVTDWSDAEVATAYALLTAEPAATRNGQPAR
jgi:hypothetical protein